MLGVGLSIAASVLFGALYYYAAWLAPLDGQQIFGWRLLLTAPAVFLLVRVLGAWSGVRELVGRLRREPLLALTLPIGTACLGLQLWLFMWAPLNGRALQVSLGYFLLPLSMVLIGRLVYRETLTPWRLLAVGLAAAGVLHELLRTGAFSWESAAVALGYPPYFLLRRALRVEALPGLLFDMVLLTPFALYIVLGMGEPVLTLLSETPRLLGLIPLMGLISALALVTYLWASRLLPLGLFGLLGYVEPVLLVLVATWLLDERLGPQAWWTYGPIWAAVAVLAIEGARHYLRGRRAARSS